VIAPLRAMSQARHNPGGNEALQTPCRSASCNSTAGLQRCPRHTSAALWQDYVIDIVDIIYAK
jgi:hypothetical protein